MYSQTSSIAACLKQIAEFNPELHNRSKFMTYTMFAVPHLKRNIPVQGKLETRVDSNGLIVRWWGGGKWVFVHIVNLLSNLTTDISRVNLTIPALSLCVLVERLVSVTRETQRCQRKQTKDQ